MRPMSESVRIHIRRLYFTQRLSFEQIAERLGIPTDIVRDAVVIDGGLAKARTPGPFYQENNK